MCPDFHQIEFNDSKRFWGLPIWSSTNKFDGQKLKYISNVTKVIDNNVSLSIYQDTEEYPTCGFCYTIQQYNVDTWRSLE